MGLNFLSLLALQLYMAHCLEGLTIQGQMYVSAQVPSLTQRTTLDKVPVQPGGIGQRFSLTSGVGRITLTALNLDQSSTVWNGGSGISKNVM